MSAHNKRYEYLDPGRFWRIFLFVGLFLWFFLMGRSLWPALKNPGPNRHLLALFILASAAIALFKLRWLCVVGDTIFALGALGLG